MINNTLMSNQTQIQQELAAYRYEVQELRQELELHRMRLRYLEKWQQEFRGPLGAIIGFPSLMLEDAADSFQREGLEAVRTSGDMLLQTVQDFFTYIAAESGQIEVNFLPIEVGYIMEEAMVFPRKLAAERFVNLQYQIADTVPHVVTTSRHITRQIISHLTSHAVKSTFEGRVDISVTAKPSAENVQEKELHVIIRDTGAGYRPEEVQRLQLLFEKPDADQAMFDGLETRLVMCKRLAEFVNGRLQVESRYQKGSTFTFIIPCERAILPTA